MLKKTKIFLGVTLVGLSCCSQFSYAEQNWSTTHTKAQKTVQGTHVSEMPDGATLKVVVSLRLRNEASLDAFVAQKLKSHSKGNLTSQQFMVTYAPTDDQVNTVTDYLSRNGYRNISVSKNHVLISADGTAGSAKRAFNTEIHYFNVNGRTAHANVGDAQVPASLANLVLAVHGLQDVVKVHTFARRASASSGTQTPIAMANFSSVYNATSLAPASNATIGIITEGDMTQTLSDLNSFASNAGYPTPNVSVVNAGNGSSDTSGIDEWNMDTQSSLAAAGGSVNSMLLYTADSMTDADLTSAYNKAVSDNLAQVINVSLGECESDASSSGTTATDDAIFKIAVAQGQTFSVAAGDSGSYECGGSTSAQSYPAVSPYVIAVGGTSLSTINGVTWANESTWSCRSSSDCQSNGGTGGGVSLTEQAPSWQTASGVLGSSTSRGVPDIAFDADPATGANVLINGSNVVIGGTSLAAPLFSGFWALIQSANNNGLGFPASTIYQNAAANPSWFHNVTTGSNGGYQATNGWNYTTGFGSLNVGNFASGF